MKFRMQHMDTEDILVSLCPLSKPHPLPHHTHSLQDTLLVSGYGAEEAEEMVARVISVMDSPEHFEEQTVAILGEVCHIHDGSFTIIL